MDVVFVHTQHRYDSYQDFFRLAELSGFPVISINELDPARECVYIISPLNGEWESGWQNPTAHIVHWDIEWRDVQQYPHVPGVREVWVSDWGHRARLADANPDLTVRYVMMGSHPGLVLQTPPPYPHFDFACLMYRPPRRERVLHDLRVRGFTVSPNAWGAERDKILRGASAMLHIHQHDGFSTIAPQRWALAAAYGLGVVTEPLNGHDPLASCSVPFPAGGGAAGWRQAIIQAQRMGERLRHLLCAERSFRTNVMEVLACV